MAKGQAGKADKQLALTNNQAATAGGTASNIYSGLEPQLSAEATNPQGYSPTDLNAMTTASQQAMGGSTAGITGQGNLQVARTRNSGGYGNELDQAARSAQQTQSQNDLGIQQANANLKQQQQQSGLSALQGLYGTNVGQQTSLLGLGPGTLGARAAGGSWAQNTFAPVTAGINSLAHA